jgi:hypothetical protein
MQRFVNIVCHYFKAVHMRNVYAVCLIVLLALVGLSCERDSVVDCRCPSPPDDLMISVAYKKTTYGYQCCDKQIAIRFANVMQDSRCPINATCVWAGTAIIGVNFNGDEKVVIPLEIHKPVQQEIMEGIWNVELTELTPQPILDHTTDPNNYTAKIRIKRI